jgi:hypothetical protein
MNANWLKITLIAAALAIPAFPQTEGAGAAPAATNILDDGDRMLTPPPATSEAYPAEFAAEARSNYMLGGLTFMTAYSDNVLGSLQGNPVSDVSYSVWPTISFDKTDARLHSTFTYSPGFTFYQHTSERNEADQNVNLDLSYRISPHVTLSVRDSFRKSSNILNQAPLDSTASITGSLQNPTVSVIPPIASQLNNGGTVELTYQFGRNAMVGASGQFTYLHYPDPAEAPGLYDSNSGSGSAFYTHRLSGRHYLGATYQYQKILAYPTGYHSETSTNTVLGFYTIYLKPTVSLSFSAGPQEVDVVLLPLPSFHQWSPAGTASLGWQGLHTSAAASFSHTVTAGGGLVGAYDSNNASASIRRQISKTWSAGFSADYLIYKTLDPAFAFGSQNGHTVSATVTAEHSFNNHLSAVAGYTRLYQTYNNIAAISGAPNTNREWISLTYQFMRPLGR